MDIFLTIIGWLILGLLFIWITEPGSIDSEIWGVVYGPILLFPILIIMFFERMKRNKNLKNFEGDK